MRTAPRTVKKARARRSAAALIAMLVLGMALPSEAVILYRTGDPTANTTAPGDDRDTAWNSQGRWGNFLGTPISAKHFITAKHVGGSVGQSFIWNSVTYTTVAEYEDPSSDLSIWEISGVFPSWVPIYTKSDEVGRELFVVGRGTRRGNEVNVAGATVDDLRGWRWGSQDRVQRWGENEVDSIQAGAGAQLYATLDRTSSLSEEAHLSVGDSGGAAFIKDPDDNIWKLAGIHYSVDGFFNLQDNNATKFNAAIFDAGGLYVGSDSSGYDFVTDEPTDIPSGFYSTRISARKDWIFQTVPEPTALGLLLLAGLGLMRRRRC